MNRGITILEMLCVFCILAILSGLSVNAYMKMDQRQRLGGCLDDLRFIMSDARRNTIDTGLRHFVTISPPGKPQTVRLWFRDFDNVERVCRVIKIPPLIEVWPQTLEEYPRAEDYTAFFAQDGTFANSDTVFYVTDDRQRFGSGSTLQQRLDAWRRQDPRIRLFCVETGGRWTTDAEAIKNALDAGN